MTCGARSHRLGYNVKSMSQGGSNKKVSNNLLALSSAAILAVYTAGYSRTQSAANRLAVQSEQRRPAIPIARDSEPSPAPLVLPAASPPSTPKREATVRPSVAVSSQPSPAKAEVSSPAAAPTPAPVETPPPAPPPVAEPAPVIAEQKPEPKVEVPAAPAAPPAPAKVVWKDGTYTGWGYSRHGDIQASVVIEGGRIVSTTIAQCNTRYSCSVIDNLIPQPPKRQTPDVDNVSGATQSADAFYYAIVEALGKAK